jgi:DNA mismatch repair protein MutL
MERRVETCSGEYRFCFEDTSEDHVVIWYPVNVTESEVSLVLEQLLRFARRNSDSSFSQNDTIAKSMAKV